MADWQSETPSSKELSKRLKAAGFRFVGPTTVWAAMQSCGLVNDHLATCWVRYEVESSFLSAAVLRHRYIWVNRGKEVVRE